MSALESIKDLAIDSCIDANNNARTTDIRSRTKLTRAFAEIWKERGMDALIGKGLTFDCIEVRGNRARFDLIITDEQGRALAKIGTVLLYPGETFTFLELSNAFHVHLSVS